MPYDETVADGCAVNRCARLRGIGHGGQVLLSAAVVALVAGGLPTGASLTDLGEHRLKDLIQPERVAQVTAPDLPSHFLPLASLGSVPTTCRSSRRPCSAVTRLSVTCWRCSRVALAW